MCLFFEFGSGIPETQVLLRRICFDRYWCVLSEILIDFQLSNFGYADIVGGSLCGGNECVAAKQPGFSKNEEAG